MASQKLVSAIFAAVTVHHPMPLQVERICSRNFLGLAQEAASLKLEPMFQDLFALTHDALRRTLLFVRSLRLLGRYPARSTEVGTSLKPSRCTPSPTSYND